MVCACLLVVADKDFGHYAPADFAAMFAVYGRKKERFINTRGSKVPRIKNIPHMFNCIQYSPIMLETNTTNKRRKAYSAIYNRQHTIH